jgi:hypothetical protein
MRYRLIAAGFLAVLLTGCGGAPKQAPEDIIPDWIGDPQNQISDGLAATDCVPAGEEFSIDRSEAVARTRQALASQIEIGVEAMDTTYQRQVRAGDDAGTGSSFESVSRQLTDQTLSGVRIHRVGYETINNQRQLCTLLVVGEASLRELFDRIIADSGRQIGSDNQALLYEEFRAYQAREEMDRALDARRGGR